MEHKKTSKFVFRNLKKSIYDFLGAKSTKLLLKKKKEKRDQHTEMKPPTQTWAIGLLIGNEKQKTKEIKEKNKETE